MDSLQRRAYGVALLLDNRYAEELREAATSVVEVSQVALSVGQAASTKLWFLLRQSLSKFQQAQDFVQLIGVQQKGASAGYELWRMLNNELSVRSSGRTGVERASPQLACP